MRFKRRDRFTFQDTPRKRAATERRFQREREDLPLFADQVRAEQPDVDQVMAARAARSVQHESTERQRRAADWKRARQTLASFAAPERHALLAYWRRNQWPGDPSYLLSMLQMYAGNRLDSVPRRPAPTGVAT